MFVDVYASVNAATPAFPVQKPKRIQLAMHEVQDPPANRMRRQLFFIFTGDHMDIIISIIVVTNIGFMTIESYRPSHLVTEIEAVADLAFGGVYHA